jgi:hypothetical protein
VWMQEQVGPWVDRFAQASADLEAEEFAGE